MVHPRLVPLQAFESMVADALDELPDSVAAVLTETVVLVEDEPATDRVPDGVLLLGQYRGVPRTRHGGRVAGTLPDTITLYRLPILRVCASPEEVGGRVLKVLGHEVGHAMGMSEERLRAGWH
jgi:predicted Zn-dependent protease with MMP-like domain